MAILLGSITAISLAIPLQARAAGFNLMQGVNLTREQKAEIARISQQSEAELASILRPEQQSLYKVYKEHPTNRSDRSSFWASLTPEQKAKLQAYYHSIRMKINPFYTPEQQKQLNHNLQVFVSELKAENKLPQTFHLGFWQPVARINPNKPLQLEVINQTNIPLQYGLTTNPPKTLLPGSVGEIKYVSAPTHILIYPSQQKTSVKYKVDTIGNKTIVEVQQVSNDITGNSSLAINGSGAIYAY
jgi:serine/threonine-protein kinase